MGISKHRLLFSFIICAFLCNLYFAYQFLVQREYSSNFIDEYKKNLHNASNQLNFYEKKDNEFLVLDWTGRQHIFQEQDPIKCKINFKCSLK